MRELNEMQERFVQEYLVDHNATAAAKRAGYSQKTAYSTGNRLLKNVEVQKRIKEAEKELLAGTKVTQSEVLGELKAIGFANATDYVEVRDGYVIVKDTDALTPAQKAAVVGIKQTKYGVEIKLADKGKALELLAKHLGILTEKQGAESQTSSLADAIISAYKTRTEGDSHD